MKGNIQKFAGPLAQGVSECKQHVPVPGSLFPAPGFRFPVPVSGFRFFSLLKNMRF